MNKVKYIVFMMLLLTIIPLKIYAGRGCCSNHGGEAGCTGDGKSVCADGIISPTCTCTPTPVYGCTNRSAKNYNSNANTDDGSCMYYTSGCTDSNAKNYNPNVEKSDNSSCEYYVMGCTDINAKNYDAAAEKDNDSCIYYVMGCRDSSAKNYDSSAEKDDGSCDYYITGCTDKKALNYNPEAEKEDNSCKYEQKNEYSGIVSNNNQNINNKYNDTASSNNDSDGDIGATLPFLVLAGIGTCVCYKGIKKNKEKKMN